MEWDFPERPDKIRTYYGVIITNGQYNAPERKPSWDRSPSKRVTREYKDHLVAVEFDHDTGDLWGSPRKLCNHSRRSGSSWERNPRWLIPAWENGDTDYQSICGHCWNSLPRERKGRLR